MVPNPPPNILVSTKIFKVPSTSSPPAIPNEKFPPITYLTPSRRKLEMGIITKSATINDRRKRGFISVAAFFNALITIFKN